MAEILGVDVSKWQGVMDWGKAAAMGVRFALCKASEGTSYLDPTFQRNANEARAQGMLVGAYHFIRPIVDVTQQADNFKKRIGDFKLDFPPVLDCEASDQLGLEAVNNFVYKLAKLMMGFQEWAYPMIYTSQGWWNANVKADKFWAHCPLWVANWKVIKPRLPRDWKDYLIWQTGQGVGMDYGAQSTQIDLNLWNPSVPFPGDPTTEPPAPPVPPVPTPDKIQAHIQVTISGVRYAAEAELKLVN